MAKAYNGIKKKIADKIAKAKQKSITIKGYNTRLSKMKNIAKGQGKDLEYDFVTNILQEKGNIKLTKSGNIAKQELTPAQEALIAEFVPGGRGYDYDEFFNTTSDRMAYESDRLKNAQIEWWNKTANKLVKSELDRFFDYIYEDGPGTRKNRGIKRESFAKQASQSKSYKVMMNDKISDIARKAASGDYTAYQLRREIEDLKDALGREE